MDEVPKCFKLCNKLYVQFGETFYMLVANVFCNEFVSTAQEVTNTSFESILFSLEAGIFHIYLLFSDYFHEVLWVTSVKASFFTYFDIISGSWYKHI